MQRGTSMSPFGMVPTLIIHLNKKHAHDLLENNNGQPEYSPK